MNYIRIKVLRFQQKMFSKKMKDLGIYKCVGARENRKIFCDFGVFVTFAYMSCPPFGASVCMIIGKNL